jgi:hypothetical protein
MFVTLKPKTREGREVVAAHGSIWLISDEAQKVAFTRRRGPWLLVESPHDTRWVHGERDKDFLVEPYGSDLDATQAEDLRRQLTHVAAPTPTRTGRKSPLVAGVLSFVFGPIGYLYIGWRYAVLGLAVLAIFATVLALINFPIPAWMKYVILGVFAQKAYAFVSVRNELIDAESTEVSALDTFPVAAMAMSDLLVGVGMFYAGTVGLYVAVRLLLEGSVLRGLLVFLVGTPVLVWIANLAFGLIALGIDAIFAPRMKNVFRQ